jgi:VWFA-related protein
VSSTNLEEVRSSRLTSAAIDIDTASTLALLMLGTLIFVISETKADQPAANDESNHISLHVSVYGRQGKSVQDLTQNDFEVLEDKKPQAITSLRFERDSPISLGVLIDISRSMGRENIGFVLDWVKSLAEKLKSPDEIFLNAFSNEPQEVVDFISPEDYLEEPLNHLGTGGQSHTGLAVDLALIKLREAKNKKRALLFVSPGFDSAGPATLDHVARFRYPIYALGLRGAIGITGTLDRLKSLNVKGSALKVYADQSGGNALFVQSSKEAEHALDTLTFEFKNQYRLEYVSSNPKRDGKLRKVEVKVRNCDCDVRYLKKYQAPLH